MTAYKISSYRRAKHTYLRRCARNCPKHPMHSSEALAPQDALRASSEPAPKQPLRQRLAYLGLEIAASGTTLTGMYLGSSTLPGASMYLLSLVFWYTLTIKRKLWGLMPLNLATTGVAAYHCWHALWPPA